MSAGRNAKARGARYENELVSLLLEQGYHAERIYGSGAIGTWRARKGKSTEQEVDDDVLCIAGDARYQIEVKYRRREFAQWLLNLTEPALSQDGEWLFVPGYDVPQAVLSSQTPRAQVLNVPTSKYKRYLTSADVLCCRFPKPGTQSSTGWVTCVPLFNPRA